MTEDCYECAETAHGLLELAINRLAGVDQEADLRGLTIEIEDLIIKSHAWLNLLLANRLEGLAELKRQEARSVLR